MARIRLDAISSAAPIPGKSLVVTCPRFPRQLARRRKTPRAETRRSSVPQEQSGDAYDPLFESSEQIRVISATRRSSEDTNVRGTGVGKGIHLNGVRFSWKS